MTSLQRPAGGEAPAAIAARGVGYVYPDGRRALSAVTFAVAPGEAVGVIGPNGTGKTTLFLALAGLLGPTEGSIEVFGQEPRGAWSPELRRRIGIVFQSTDEQLFSPTVVDDVAFGPLNFGLPRSEVRLRAERALAAAGIKDLGDRSPHHLSQGEKRRAALATVLSYEPEILILDELTSDLDPRGRKELVTLLAGMGQIRIIASHDLEFIARTCRRVLILNGGSLRSDLPAVEALTGRALLESNGLEVPLGFGGLDGSGLERLLNF